MARGRKGGRRAKGRGGSARAGYQDQAGFPLVKQVADAHRFVRRDIRVLDLGSAGTGSGFAYTFALSNLINYTDFTALFDTYCIDRVDIVLVPGSAAIQVYGAPDFDDAVAPVGVSDLLERQNVMVRGVSTGSIQQFRASVVPRVHGNVGADASVSMMPPGQRLDCAAPSVLHYGYKFWIIAPTGTATASPSIVFTYHLRMFSAK